MVEHRGGEHEVSGSQLLLRPRPCIAALLFHFPLQDFRFGNCHDRAKDASEITELIFGITLRLQFVGRLRDGFL